MKLRAADLREGDLVDLEGDPYADPSRNPAHGFEFQLAQVVQVTRETPECVAVGFEGFDVVGFPRDHLLTVTRDT